MKTNLLKKIKQYTALASAGVAGMHTAQADIIYTDINPDTLMNDSTEFFSIDFDSNSTIDFTFNFDKKNSFNYGLANGSIMGYASSYTYISVLNYNDVISNSQNFVSNCFVSCTFNGSTSYYFGPQGNFTDKYIGVRFLIDTSLHYGWIRWDADSLFNSINFKDFAYNDIPNLPIKAGQNFPIFADTCQQLIANDVADNLNATDLQATFLAAANETGISEYRIFVAKTSNLASLTIDSARNVTNFMPISPNGGPYVIPAPMGAVDIDGDSIVQGISYTVVVLSVPNGITTTNLSMTFSNPLTLTYIPFPVQAVSNLIGADISNNLNGSDFEVSFTVPTNDDAGISEYRVFVAPTSVAGSFDLAAAQSNFNYITLIANGTNKTQVLPVAMKDINGTSLAQNVPYTIFVQSVSNLNMPPYDLDTLTTSSASVTLSNTTDLDKKLSDNDVQIFGYNGTVHVINKRSANAVVVTVFNSVGQEIHYESFSNQEYTVSLNKNQLYLIKVEIDGKFLVKKVIL